MSDVTFLPCGSFYVCGCRSGRNKIKLFFQKPRHLKAVEMSVLEGLLTNFSDEVQYIMITPICEYYHDCTEADTGHLTSVEHKLVILSGKNIISDGVW